MGSSGETAAACTQPCFPQKPFAETQVLKRLLHILGPFKIQINLSVYYVILSQQKLMLLHG